MGRPAPARSRRAVGEWERRATNPPVGGRPCAGPCRCAERLSAAARSIRPGLPRPRRVPPECRVAGRPGRHGGRPLRRVGDRPAPHQAFTPYGLRPTAHAPTLPSHRVSVRYGESQPGRPFGRGARGILGQFCRILAQDFRCCGVEIAAAGGRRGGWGHCSPAGSCASMRAKFADPVRTVRTRQGPSRLVPHVSGMAGARRNDSQN
jgi:hypothetical protein